MMLKSRREFIHTLALGAASIGLSGCLSRSGLSGSPNLAAAKPSSGRKGSNILFVFADQMHRYALGCMGTADIVTPNLDRLAAQGTLFRNAYSNCPICTPYRINLLTGLYTCQTNTFDNSARIPAGRPTLADCLNAGHLRTSYIGKWHIGGMGNGPIAPELRGGFTDFLGYQCYNAFNDGVCFYDEQNREYAFTRHRTDVTTDLAIQRLDGLANQPFALFVSYQAPHYPVQPAPEYEAMYRGRRIRRRPNCRDVEPYTPTQSPPSPRPRERDPDYQKYGGNLDEYLRLYYALVTQLDANVGRLLAALERLGLAENTTVIFTSDHGDMQGSHGLTNKFQPYEESTGVPLIVRTPGGPAGRISDALVSGIDLFPTCLDYAGLPPAPGLPGVSFAPLTRGQPQHLTNPVFSEMRKWKMVREGDLKLVVETAGAKPTMLFNLADDPFEQKNLVDDPACQADVLRLRKKILAWLGIQPTTVAL